MDAQVKQRWFPPLKRSTPLSPDRTSWSENERRLRFRMLFHARCYRPLSVWSGEDEAEYLELRLEICGF